MNTRQGALRLTLNYLLVAGLWIVFSDKLVAALELTARQTEQVQVWKGLVFVLLTGALLYLTINRHLRNQATIGMALRASEERLSLALSATEDGLWDWDLRNRSVYYSPGYHALLGMHEGELSTDREQWQELLHPDDRAPYQRALNDLLQAEEDTSSEHSFRLRHRDGSYRWVLSRGRLQLDSLGRPARFIGTVKDVTQSRADADSLRQAAAVFESTQEGVLVTDAQQTIVHINPAFSRITGYSEAEILGKHPTLLKSGRHDETFYQHLWHTLQTQGSWSGEVWNRRKDGEIYPQWQCIRAIQDANGLLSHYVAVFSDITVLKHSQHELDHLVHHDPLSGLPNRLLFSERVEHALQRAQRDARRGAVLVIDLDHFKHINESLGHNVGDMLLKAAGERLAEQIGTGATLARLGGDEFAVLSEDCGLAEQAGQLAQTLIDCLDEPFMLDGQELFISASAGVCLYPGDAQTVDQVLRNVDSALFKAKSSGRGGFAFYDQEQTEYARQRVELIAGMRHAIENGELRVHYQPLHCLVGSRMIGVEALVRWQHPQRGLVPPGEFIPVAEDSGMISAIDAWVLEHACRQMVTWRAAGHSLEFVAVNVSSRLFSRGELDQRVSQVLQATGLPAACLELEVTESAVMDDPDQAQALLERLRALGVRLAIDDFGTGYSSLARLKRLPVHKLKLDQSFVAGLPHDKDDLAITRAVIALAHSMDLKVLAEGVERAEQLEHLRRLGCDYVQGYFIGRPVSHEELKLS
ncbi:putative bifunctional diguanylate cyclase/phosphodiesterase [Phytopseudomonas punonensis]|uniref:cyclic-guanylate-specific phosphodiesterase n=1 Tax=Phytopseudomonas punonensis TaxID=1220495 RepID=A0A1M6ZGT4_9GAMM|nr:GGDEF domain-containing phosphodiesterase [Pseudomonas punonensis]SHL29678.1 diguanylate cyclase/phosphodiesterase with PAS/PAC sensor(s) [Pseudomonas punonensis]